jgi:putative PEP-CTERM system integral membrane protein
VVGSLDELWPRFLAARRDRGQVPASARADLVDGYLWTTVPANTPVAIGDSTAVAPTDGFAAFAARRLILDAAYRQRAAIGEPPDLDRLHAVAREHAIVTPYSSMIVLVTSDQQRRLDELEKAGDRFEREGEAAGETVPGNPTNVTAVPEPHEWLLLGLAVLMLGWYVRRRRLQPREQSARA